VAEAKRTIGSGEIGRRLMRPLILATVLTATLLALPTLLEAQQPDVPAPAPDQVVIIGEVPAPPGTTVTVQFADVETLDIFTCGTTTTTPADEDGRSRFVLVIEASCVHFGFPASFCWGEGLCDGYDPFPQEEHYLPGTIVDVGFLEFRPPEAPRPGAPGGGGDIASPTAYVAELPRSGGVRAAAGDDSEWIVAGLAGLAVVLGAASLVLRRRAG